MAFSAPLHSLQLVSISWPDILYEIRLLNETDKQAEWLVASIQGESCRVQRPDRLK